MEALPYSYTSTALRAMVLMRAERPQIRTLRSLLVTPLHFPPERIEYPQSQIKVNANGFASVPYLVGGGDSTADASSRSRLVKFRSELPRSRTFARENECQCE